MTKEQILKEIRRIAERDGAPPGSQKFERLTGIAKSKWYGVHWARWGDALIEAGFSPNTKQQAFDSDRLIRLFLEMVDELGRVPTDGDIRLKSRSASSFPGHSTFRNRLGKKNELLKKVIEYAKANRYPVSNIALLNNAFIAETLPVVHEDTGSALPAGFVYLMRSGKYHKIGYTNSPDRRQYEIGIQLAEKVELIHSIETDDPSGIEAYWHNRFRDKHQNGEWFNLTAGDVRAFRKRKFM